jgi:predicted Zn-dependent protease
LPIIDDLIAERPTDPYFHELRGQIMFENGRPAEAIPEYRMAVQILPNNASLRQELGSAELEADDPAALIDAKEQFTTATRNDPSDAETWRLFATAYGKAGDEAMAAAGMAEYALLVGRYSEALFDANKALKGLKHGTPMAIRMEDVRAAAESGRDNRGGR